MKPLNRKNYGSITHLSNSKLGSGDHFINHGQEKILTETKRDKHDEIFVFEKYDGSNVGIGKIDGNIYPLTRNGYTAITSPHKQHHMFHKWVFDNEVLWKDLLKDGERITGEWLVQAHGLRYDIKPYIHPIVFFDHFNKNNERSEFDLLDYFSEIFEIQLPRILHRGESKSVDELKTELNKKTADIRSIDKPEGMVYRVERKCNVDFLAKWVRKDFVPGRYIIDKGEDEFIWNKKL